MAKLSRKMAAARAKVDPEQLYSLEEAMGLSQRDQCRKV